MAIEFNRLTRSFFLVCDECGEESVETFETFCDARRGAKVLGWETYLISLPSPPGEVAPQGRRGREWVNYCPGCREAGVKTPAGCGRHPLAGVPCES